MESSDCRLRKISAFQVLGRTSLYMHTGFYCCVSLLFVGVHWLGKNHSLLLVCSESLSLPYNRRCDTYNVFAGSCSFSTRTIYGKQIVLLVADDQGPVQAIFLVSEPYRAGPAAPCHRGHVYVAHGVALGGPPRGACSGCCLLIAAS